MKIKFRGQRVGNKEFVYGNLIYSSDAYKKYETLIIPQKDADGFTTDYASNGENKESFGFDNWFCVIPETVGQYTGLKDKNGKEIYEGDICIVKTVYMHQYTRYLVKHYNCGFRLYLDNHYMCLCEIDERDIEVIGTIYENPELLEVEN